MQYARNDLREEGLFEITANNSNRAILFREYIRVIPEAFFYGYYYFSHPPISFAQRTGISGTVKGYLHV